MITEVNIIKLRTHTAKHVSDTAAVNMLAYKPTAVGLVVCMRTDLDCEQTRRPQ